MRRSKYKIYEPIFAKVNAKTILDQLSFCKKFHKTKAQHQVWQEGVSPKLIQNEK
jgi:hypothetical protein